MHTENILDSRRTAFTHKDLDVSEWVVDLCTSSKFWATCHTFSDSALKCTIKIWDKVTGDLVQKISSTSIINSINLSSDGTRIIAGDSDSLAKIWDVYSGALIITMKGPFQRKHPWHVTAVRMSPDDQILAIGYLNGTIALCDVYTGAVRTELTDPNGLPHTGRAVFSIRFSDNGTRIGATVGGSGKIWDMQSGELQCRLKSSTEGPRCLVFDPNRDVVYTTSIHDRVRAWNLTSMAELKIQQEPSQKIQQLVVSPDGHWLAGSDMTGNILLWNLDWCNTPVEIRFQETLSDLYKRKDADLSRRAISAFEFNTLDIGSIICGRSDGTIEYVDYPG